MYSSCNPALRDCSSFLCFSTTAVVLLYCYRSSLQIAITALLSHIIALHCIHLSEMSDPVASSSSSVHAAASSAGPGSIDEKPKKPSGGRRQQHGRREETPDVRISKALSYILRHGAAKESLTMRPDGFVRVDELVSLSSIERDISKQYTDGTYHDHILAPGFYLSAKLHSSNDPNYRRRTST